MSFSRFVGTDRNIFHICVLKLIKFSSEKIVPVDGAGLSTFVCNQTRGAYCSNTLHILANFINYFLISL